MESDPGTRRSGRLRLFLLLFSSSLVFIAAGAVAVGCSVQRFWEGALRGEITRNLTQKARMFATQLETDHSHKIADLTSQAGHDAGARATVIDGNGKVVADSEIPVASLEHEGRTPEFVRALHGEVAVDLRRRAPFGVEVLYVAVPISGGAVRFAYPLADVAIAGAKSRNSLLIGVGIAVLAALAVSALTTQTITSRKTPSIAPRL